VNSHTHAHHAHTPIRSTAASRVPIIPEADKLFDRKPAYTMDQLVPVGLI
jgi:hypothetical protein